MGEMVILNEGLKEKGVKVGDRVCYKPHQDYEFVVDEQVLYRMYDHSIVAVL
jgi:co-chaperonin GroES (HSP10)